MNKRKRSGGKARLRRGEAAEAPARRRVNAQRELRIIGGRWRGRRWQIASGAQTRPTPDRVRETLFNWLMHSIVGAHCIDAFGGSGALGLEALSRGAASVRFLETDTLAAAGIRACLRDWQGSDGVLLECDALTWLETAKIAPADIVFLDPPFAANLLPRALAALDRRGWLSAVGQVYVEHSFALPMATLPQGWTVHRSGRAGAVSYHLLSGAAIRSPVTTSSRAAPGEHSE